MAHCKCFTCENHDGDDCEDFFYLCQIDCSGECENNQTRGRGDTDDQEGEAMTPEEELAKRFHDLYESLATKYDYRTRKASAVKWEDVPTKNRLLMTEVCSTICGDSLAIGRKNGLEEAMEIADAEGSEEPADGSTFDKTWRAACSACSRAIYLRIKEKP